MKYQRKSRIVYSKVCNYLGLEYGYVIGVGWLHCGTQNVLKPESFKSMKAYKDFIDNLEFEANNSGQ